ncbi:hypothetical protein DICVIV_01885 [Dictyocaulus viviparus]|uniref:Uncharacterized protein n=1 Tax=Dictyocaulus viviparus TaxID=29172 RepID=A0A0D8Y7F6_DICVI|nr:hypothetical protein DICVIV_01885 [Dictyocaulus viviparus]
MTPLTLLTMIVTDLYAPHAAFTMPLYLEFTSLSFFYQDQIQTLTRELLLYCSPSSI